MPAKTKEAEQGILIPKKHPEYEEKMVALDRLDISGAMEPPAALVESIRDYGILVPPIVRKGRTRNKFIVIDGRRRIRAARILEMEKIEVRVATGAGDVLGSVLTLQANSMRSANVLAELHAIERLQERGATEKDLVAATGLKTQTVRSRLRILNLTPALRQGLEEGKIPIGVGEAAAKLPKGRLKGLEKVLEGEGRLTHGDVEDARKVGSWGAVATLGDEIFAPVGVQTWQEQVQGLIESALKLIPDIFDTRKEDAVGNAIRGDLQKALTRSQMREEKVPKK